MSEIDKKREEMLLRGIFTPHQLIARVATHAAMDILDRRVNSPYFSIHGEEQVGQLAAEISLELTSVPQPSPEFNIYGGGTTMDALLATEEEVNSGVSN